MALNFKSLLTRTLTASIFVAVLLSCIFWNYYSFAALFFVVSVWGLHEFFKISELLGAKPFKLTGYLIAITFYLSIVLEHLEFSNENLMNISIWTSCILFLVSFGLPFVMFAGTIFSKNEKPILDATYTFFGVFYCIVPFYLLNKLVFPFAESFYPGRFYNSHIVLGMILLIWASDTYAYLVGSLVGKTKLIERISPGKTWEGTIGGGVLTLASSYIVYGWFPEIAFIHWFVIAAIVVVFGTLGDLFESLLKRQAGIKDSGKIMPGHGGILDRFDSLIFVTPFVYLYLTWVLG